MMGPPLEERLFEYARGAAAGRCELTPEVVQQLVALAYGDVQVLHSACAYCEQVLAASHPEDSEGERVLALLRAAIERAKDETRD